MNTPIDLNEEGDFPASPMSQSPQYPEMTLSHPDLVNFPDTGRAVISHEVISRTHEKDPNGKGKHHHRIRIKVKSIRPMGRRKSGGTMAAATAMKDLIDNESK